MKRGLIYVLFFSVPFLGLNGCKNPEAKKRSDTENCKDIIEINNEFPKLEVMVKKLQTEEFSQSKVRLKSLCENIKEVPDTLSCQDEAGKAIVVSIITKTCNDLDGFLKPYEEYFAEVPGLAKGERENCQTIALTTAAIERNRTPSEKSDAKAKLCTLLGKSGENYRCEVKDQRDEFVRWDSKSRLHKEYCH